MITLHIIADNADPRRIDRAIEYLVNTKQTQATVAGGAQIDVAMNIVERIHARLPNCLIFWRILEDTGNVINMGSNEWWSGRVAPRLKWMQEHKLVMVVDNETSGDDNVIRTYTANSITRWNMLHSAGLGGAFCRFATGNIQETQYGLLLPLLQKLDTSDWISPNEYSNRPGASSGGHLERYKHIEAVLPSKKFNISIGEAGILNNYQARHGWQTIPMRGQDVAAQMIGEEIWYRAGSIARHYFAVGGYGWDSLQPDDAMLTFWEDYYAKNPIAQLPPPPVTPPLPPVVTPPPTVPLLTSVEISYLEAWRDTMQARLNIVNKVIAYAKGSK